MKTRHALLFLALSTISIAVSAQDVVPATTEDVKAFDEKVAENPEVPADDTNDKVKKEKKEKKDNFGKTVSEEAHRMKTLPKDERHKMGPWVSAQRRKDGAKKSDQSGSDSSYGGAADARSSAPHGKSAGKGNRKN